MVVYANIYFVFHSFFLFLFFSTFYPTAGVSLCLSCGNHDVGGVDLLLL
jgi:hypothetical protein